MGSRVLNSSLAGALGRPDLMFAAQQSTLYAGSPPTVIGGSSQSLLNSTDGSGLLDNGRSALLALMLLIGAYAAFTWWVRPHLA